MYKILNTIRNKIFAFIYPLINNFVSGKNKFLRNYITKNTSGDILEIGAGNGGNLNHYKNYNNLILLLTATSLFSSLLISCYIIRTFVEHVCTTFVLC